MASDAISYLRRGITPNGEEGANESFDFLADEQVAEAVTHVLKAAAAEIGDPALAQLSILPILVLRFVSETGLTSPDAIRAFPIGNVVAAIRADPSILVHGKPLRYALDSPARE